MPIKKVRKVLRSADMSEGSRKLTSEVVSVKAGVKRKGSEGCNERTKRAKGECPHLIRRCVCTRMIS